MMDTCSRLALAAGIAVALSVGPSYAREYHSYAFVNDDATLRISGQHIRLYGVHIPGVSGDCGSKTRELKCSKSAARALDFKIRGFVRCEALGRHRDRSITARCFNRDEDLSAYLLERGLAVALPGAPIEYTTLERIAERRGAGIWGKESHPRAGNY